MKKLVALLLLLSLLALSLVSCGGTPPADTTTAPDANKVKYDTAVAYISEGKYAEAYALFEELGAYEDSEEYLGRFRYMVAKLSFIEDDYEAAATVTFGANGLPQKITVTYSDTEVMARVISYDDKGRITQELDLDPEGYSYGTAYVYDANGNVISKTHTETDTDGDKRTTGYTYTYNAEGKLIQETYLSADGSTRVNLTCTYDQSGHLVQEIQYLLGEARETNYTYDANGNLLKKEYNSKFGLYTSEYTYDANGKKLTYKYSEDEALVSSSVYTYDVSGNLTLETCTYVGDSGRPDGYVQTTTYTYDANGNMLSEEFVSDGELYYTIEWTYDANGNLIRMMESVDDGETEGFELEYTPVYISPDITEADFNYVSELLFEMWD